MKDYFNDNYTIYKKETKVFSKNQNNKDKNIYFNTYREYPENNYNNSQQNFFHYNNINNPQIPKYIPFNVINNNISSNDRIYQKYYYINERNTPLHNYSTINNNNFRSSIPDFFENKIEKNNLEENNYLNKTSGFKALNRTLSYYNNKSRLYSASKSDNLNLNDYQLYLRQNSKFYLSIYRNKLIKVFVKNINKIIEKNKKKQIIKRFFNNLKNNYNRKSIKSNYFNNKYIQSDHKYNEYKDMIYNYIKSKNDLPMSEIYNMLRPKDKFFFNTINKKDNNINNKQRDKSSKNSSGILPKKIEIEKFKKLQKKYGTIYSTKKKQTLSFEDKIKNYINQKTIESTPSINIDNHIPRKKIIFKHKIKKSKNLSNIISEERKKNENINENDKSNNTLKSNKSMKRKKRLDSNSSSKSYKTLSDFRNVYNIYIIKNIITSDKRLFVYIKYINLDNFKNKKKNAYTKDILEISEIMNININRNKNMKSNIIKHKKKLSKIEEETDDKLNNNLSMSIRDDKYQEKSENENNQIKPKKEIIIDNNKKAYNIKKYNLSNLKKRYINYKNLKTEESEEK